MDEINEEQMRRLFIIRKDLHLTAGKMSAMVAHCAEAYWTRLIANSSSKIDVGYEVSFVVSTDTMEDYIKGLFVKTVCEAKNLNHLMKVVPIADELGLVEGVDYGFIDDACLTELTPDSTDAKGNPVCRVGVWFKPLDDETSHMLSKKYQLYRDQQPQLDREVTPGSVWRHFKGTTAKVITVCKHSETGEELVVYECSGNDGKTNHKDGQYARPMSMFLSEVDHEKYPDVKQKYRLEKIRN